MEMFDRALVIMLLILFAAIGVFMICAMVFAIILSVKELKDDYNKDHMRKCMKIQMAQL